MSLTRVSPALFQVSNNITSVTVGGSANTVSLTFDSNGVITGASNNALSVANTQITGLIQAAQIGSANATLVTSGTLPAARLPAGSVLQVVNVVKLTSFSTTSLSFVDITGLTASITPSSTNSKILALVTWGAGGGAASAAVIAVNLVRGATNLLQPTTVQTYSASQVSYTNTVAPVTSASITCFDSPASVSAVTYKCQVKTNSGATAYIGNRSSADMEMVSTITLMEIAG